MAKDELEELIGQRDTAEQSTDRLRVPMLVFVGIVAVGLLVELFVIIVLFSRTHNWLDLIELLGTSLVALGVTGELCVERVRYRRENTFRAENAKVENYYPTTLTGANDKIAELKAELAYRDLTEAQKLQLVDALNAYGAQPFTVTVSTPTSEVVHVCRWLPKVLEEAGWALASNSFITRPEGGVQVLTGPGAPESSKGAARALARELQRFGVVSHEAEDERLGDSRYVFVWVRQKPR